MGLGHNFFKCFLIENYDLIEDPKQLNGYVGYKDSLNQVMLFDVKNLASKQDKLKKNKKSNERENTQ